jgi:hypothetical protein
MEGTEHLAPKGEFDMAKTYAEEVAQMQRERAQEEAEWRQTYQQEDWEGQIQSVADEYNESIRERDEARKIGDEETARYYDRNAVRLYTEYRQLVPEPPPPPHPDQVELYQKNLPYLQKYGQPAAKQADYWHRYWGQRGIVPGHPDYKERMRDSLELYGKNANMPYDRKDELPTPNEAMNMASAKRRITPQDYNSGVAAMRQGKIGRG